MIHVMDEMEASPFFIRTAKRVIVYVSFRIMLMTFAICEYED